MSNDWTPEQAATSGYPVPPDSSPAPGADEQGAPPAPSGAPPAPAQQPDPNHPRFNEIYGKMKAAERELEAANERLARYESLEQPMGAPPPPPQYEQPSTGASPQDDPEAWLKNTVADAVKEHIAPIQQTLTQQQQLAQQQHAAAQFRAAHPEYDHTRDGAQVLGVYQRLAGHGSLEDAYRIAFPERAVAQAQPAPQGAPAPVADVPAGHVEQPGGETPEALMRKLADPSLTAYEREQIGAQLRDLGAWGMGAVERALGYQ